MGFLAPKMAEMFKAGMGGGSGASATPGSAQVNQEDEDAAKKMLVGMLRIKGMKKGGKVSSASARADGCAIRGKTRA